jgi:hypothetical protein
MAVRWFLAFLPCTTSNVTKRKTRTTSPDRCVSCFWRLSALASRRLADQVLFLADTGLCKFRRSSEAGSRKHIHGARFPLPQASGAAAAPAAAVCPAASSVVARGGFEYSLRCVSREAAAVRVPLCSKAVIYILVKRD